MIKKLLRAYNTKNKPKLEVEFLGENKGIYVALALVSEWLGHSQLETTRDYYASTNIEMKRQAINIATSSLNPLNNQVLNYEYDYTDDELVRKLYGLK